MEVKELKGDEAREEGGQRHVYIFFLLFPFVLPHCV